MLYPLGAVLEGEGPDPLHLAAGAEQAGIEVESPFEPVLLHQPDHPFVLLQPIIEAERKILLAHAYASPVRCFKSYACASSVPPAWFGCRWSP